jgi:hypothetical protein
MAPCILNDSESKDIEMMEIDNQIGETLDEFNIYETYKTKYEKDFVFSKDSIIERINYLSNHENFEVKVLKPEVKICVAKVKLRH